MGLFDDLLRTAKNQASSAARNTVNNAFNSAVNNASQSAQPAPAQSNKSEKIVFSSYPSDLEGFKALPEGDLSTPFRTAAMTVLAFTYFPKNKELCYSMLQFLRGPREMTPAEKQFINDRFMDGVDYVPRSYFEGATPQNDYHPSTPLTVTVSENPYSYGEENYAKLYLKSGGADSPRQITLRLAKDGKWYLWEQFLLSGIRQPDSADPWA